jgi:hypothetical protein
MEWYPPVVRPTAQDQFVILGCRVHQTVAVMAWAGTAQVLLVVTVSWVGTVGAVSPPLVRSCGGDSVIGVEELYVQETFHFR